MEVDICVPELVRWSISESSADAPLHVEWSKGPQALVMEDWAEDRVWMRREKQGEQQADPSSYTRRLSVLRLEMLLSRVVSRSSPEFETKPKRACLGLRSSQTLAIADRRRFVM